MIFSIVHIIGKEQSRIIVDAFKFNNTVEAIEIGSWKSCFIEVFAELLKFNKTFTRFEIGCYELIGFDALKSISDGLKVNKSIKKIYFNFAFLTNEQAIELSNTLKENVTIQKIYFKRARFSEFLKKTFFEAVEGTTKKIYFI